MTLESTWRLGRARVVRASRVVRVRLIAARVLCARAWTRPADVARAARRAWRTWRTEGTGALVEDANAAVHRLARAGADDGLLPRLRRRRARAAYRAWVERHDRLDEEARAAALDATARLAHRPLLSVLMPVYNTDERWLRAAIGSVRSQLYDRWELCVADDCSTDPRVGEVLRELAAEEPRIRLHFRPANGHISAASNSALALASGEFVALLDHDDELPPHALAAVVHELNRHPDADIVYSDEDRIDEAGRRFDPYFKPDWNPELFRGQNLISHLGVYRTEAVRRVGGFREGFEGSQDYDLALRIVEQTTPERIRHVPHVLYHWRAIRGSTALHNSEKAYAHGAGRRAVQAHLDRLGIGATCEPAPLLPYHQRVRYPLPEPRPHVTIIVPTRDRVDLLARCLDSVFERSTYGPLDVMVVDNGSRAPATAAYLDEAQERRPVTVLRDDGPFNFSRLNNRAASAASGSLLCFLNNDTEVITPGWLEEMASLAVREDVGAVGAMLYYPDDTIQHGGVILGLGGVASHAHRGLPRGSGGHYGRAALTQAMSAVTAACLVVRRTVFEAAGGFDERLAVAFNDVDLCLRIAGRGLRNVWTPFAELYHFESVSRGDDRHASMRRRFEAESAMMAERWGPLLRADPYYNPNLSLDRADFALADPPRHGAPWWRTPG